MEFPCQMCLTWMTWKCLTWSSMSNAFDMEIPCQIWHSHFSNDLKIHWHGNSMSNLKLTLLETAFDMEIPCQTCNDETAFDMEFPCQMWFFPLTWKFHVKYVSDHPENLSSWKRKAPLEFAKASPWPTAPNEFDKASPWPTAAFWSLQTNCWSLLENLLL